MLYIRASIHIASSTSRCHSSCWPVTLNQPHPSPYTTTSSTRVRRWRFHSHGTLGRVLLFIKSHTYTVPENYQIRSMASNGQGAKSSNVWTSARATQKKQALSSADGGERSDTSSSQSSRGSSASRWADPPTAQVPQHTVQRGSSSSANESGAGSWAGTSKSSESVSGSKMQGQTSRHQSNSLNTASFNAPVQSDLRRRDAKQPLGGEIDPMSLIASPSRGIQGAQSASLGSAEDQDLTNFSTQARFREYISTRIRAHCEKHPRTTLQGLIPSWLPDGWEKETNSGTSVASPESKAARNGLEEVLLLVRKLREGIMASRRSDGAALEGE